MFFRYFGLFIFYRCPPRLLEDELPPLLPLLEDELLPLLDEPEE
jgi:hypothetical protein